MAQPIVCEYVIQNDENDFNPKSNPYPNVFLLPKKYNSIQDVRLQDVFEAFPLAYSDLNYKYHLRFETVLQVSQTKRITAWMDADPNLDIACPHNKGKIKIKALRLPKGISLKKLPKQDRQFQHTGQDKYAHSKSQRNSSLGLEKPFPQPPTNQRNSNIHQHEAPHQQQQEKRGVAGLNFPDLSGVFSKLGGLFDGGSQQQVDPRQAQSNGTNQQNVLFHDSNEYQYQGFQQQQQPYQQQQQNSLFEEQPGQNAWDNFQYQQPKEQYQNKNLLFSEEDEDDDGYQKQENQKQPNYNTNNVYQEPTSNMSSDGFDIFANHNSQPPTNAYAPPQQNQAFGSDLFDLNFNSEPVNAGGAYAPPEMNPPQGKGGEGHKPPQNQASSSRINDVQNIFNQQAEQKENWDKASGKHEERINQWVGKGPMKNHIRVLLCTLQDVLWQGNGWQRVGMDKLMDAQEVKKYYRKATMLCHPDKVGSNSGSDPDKVYIANRCFAAITEAYNIFKLSYIMKIHSEGEERNELWALESKSCQERLENTQQKDQHLLNIAQQMLSNVKQNVIEIQLYLEDYDLEWKPRIGPHIGNTLPEQGSYKIC